MFKAPQNDRGDDRVDRVERIELIDFDRDDRLSTTDVEFGRTSSGSTTKWWAIAAVAAVVAAGIFVFGERHHSKSTAPPLSSAPVRSISVASAPPTSTSSSESTIPATTPANGSFAPAPVDTVASFGPIYPNTAGLGLFASNLAIGIGSARIDLDSGAVTSPAPTNRSGGGGAVLAITGSGPNARALTTDVINGDFVVPCSDGTFWILRGQVGDAASLPTSKTLLIHVRILPSGLAEVTQTVDVTSLRSAYGFSGLGTTADDLPVVIGPDGRGYTVDPVAGSFQVLTGGRLVASQHGAYADVVCTATAACSTELHGAGLPPVTLANETDTQVSFSPDGRYALLISYPSDAAVVNPVRLADLRAGKVTELFGARAPTTLFFEPGQPPWAVWSPDSSTAMFIGGTNLDSVDIATETVTILPLPRSAAIGSDWTLLAIA